MSDGRILESSSALAAPFQNLHDHALRLAGIGIWECELATERLSWTEGVYDLFGFPIGNALRRAAIVDLYLDESRRDMEFARAEAIRTSRPTALDAQIRTWRGETRWMRLSINVACDDGRPVRIFGTKQDVTADRQMLEHLRLLAESDPLTGLANRAVFEARFREVPADEMNHGGASALVLIDLDRFKALNDTHGHLAGDAALREMAARLRRAFPDPLLLARLGGDEFVVLLRAPLGRARVARMLEQASTLLNGAFLWNGLRLELGASIGAALVGRPHLRPISELFVDADCALYAAKAAGRGATFVFGGGRRSTPAQVLLGARAA
jgi:diguanylate cyclase (GGDEF)-like protein